MRSVLKTAGENKMASEILLQLQTVGHGDELGGDLSPHLQEDSVAQLDVRAK
jgi:hypothetical protein